MRLATGSASWSCNAPTRRTYDTSSAWGAALLRCESCGTRGAAPARRARRGSPRQLRLARARRDEQAATARAKCPPPVFRQQGSCSAAELRCAEPLGGDGLDEHLKIHGRSRLVSRRRSADGRATPTSEAKRCTCIFPFKVEARTSPLLESAAYRHSGGRLAAARPGTCPQTVQTPPAHARRTSRQLSYLYDRAPELFW